MKCQNQTVNLLQSKINLFWCICVLFYSSFVCIPAYADVYFKTTIIKHNIKTILNAGVPSSQALPGFLIAVPPSVCVPEVIGVLTVPLHLQPHNHFRAIQRERNFCSIVFPKYSTQSILTRHKNMQKAKFVKLSNFVSGISLFSHEHSLH